MWKKFKCFKKQEYSFYSRKLLLIRLFHGNKCISRWTFKQVVKVDSERSGLIRRRAYRRGGGGLNTRPNAKKGGGLLFVQKCFLMRGWSPDCFFDFKSPFSRKLDWHSLSRSGDKKIFFINLNYFYQLFRL